MKVDSQVVELLGRQRLIGELLRDGLEVAVPVRDRGIDVIAYAELNRQVMKFASRPIQMKAATTSAFGVDQKYARIADLIIAFVWYVDDPKTAVSYALTYKDAYDVAKKMLWTETASWREGRYTTTAPSKKLMELLKPHRMSPGLWWKLIVGSEKIADPRVALDCPTEKNGE